MSRYYISALVFFLMSMLGNYSPALAQIILDQRTSSSIPGGCINSCRIFGETIAGNNLFHSFTRFSIPSDTRVIFDNPGVENILVQVTGDEISRIRGRLRVDDSANFFFLNPQGIIFGSEAQLNIKGSFVFTTSDILGFQESEAFDLLNQDIDIALLQVHPSALQFTNGDRASIHIRNQPSYAPLQVARGQTATFIGRNIYFTHGILTTSNSSINLIANDSILIEDSIIRNQSKLPNNNLNSSINIHVGNTISLLQKSEISITNRGNGSGSQIEILTNYLSITGESQIRATSESRGNGGNIILNADDLILLNYGEILTNTSSQDNSSQAGIAGEIQINSVNLILDNNSRILSENNATQGGEGGSIRIDVDAIEASNSSISASDSGSGAGGDIHVSAREIVLNESEIVASIGKNGDGGNVRLNEVEILALQNGSQISSSAGGGGNGGNINIESALVFAVPGQNNDLIADAQRGRGGNIEIAARGIFGLEERAAGDGNGTNDIDASSRFGPDGVVNINRLAPDPSQGLLDLPSSVVNVAGLVDQGVCQNIQGSSFRAIGRGGVAPSARDSLGNNQLWEDWRSPTVAEPSPAHSDHHLPAPTEQSMMLTDLNQQPTEAQGWVVGADGTIRLVANRNGLERSFGHIHCSS